MKNANQLLRCPSLLLFPVLLFLSSPLQGQNCDDNDPQACECKGVLMDTDRDGTPDCEDLCPKDPRKTEPGQCGCGVNEIDMNGDGVLECEDMCPDDPNKTKEGQCGCGNPDTDTDGDGTADCNDWCPNDPNKTEDGHCGCGNPDTDTDGDGTPDCNDWCPDDPNKTEDGRCGCGNPDPGTPCDDGDECTIDDRITDDCECKGIPKDTPECRSETCVQEIGTPCDDGDDCTIDDQITEDCTCKGTPKDSDGDGAPDCDDPCPDDANDFCEECPADLEGCDSFVSFLSCDRVLVCLGKDISNIVVDLGPTGFQSYEVDAKFDNLNGKRWTYTAPEGQTINGLWVKTAAFCGKCTDDEELYGCVDCEGEPCPQGNGAGPYYRNNQPCNESCSDDDPDSDGDGRPDCRDICPEDPEDQCAACAELEGCNDKITFPSCDRVVVCTGEKIQQIVVDLGPSGFQHFSVDPKFAAINDHHWEYVAPESQTIQGIWVKTSGYCDKCGDDDLFSCVDCVGEPCPRGEGGGRYYKNVLPDCANNAPEEEAREVEYDLYPNPTSHELFIKFRNLITQRGSVQIMNPNGNIVHHLHSNDLTVGDLRIDLGNVPPGLYFMRIVLDSGEVLTKQFVLTD